jgi:hypothetical protein
VVELNLRAALLQLRQPDAIDRLVYPQVLEEHGFAGQLDVLVCFEQVVRLCGVLFQGGQQSGFHLGRRLSEILGPRDKRGVPVGRGLPRRERDPGAFRRELAIQPGDVAPEAQLA